MIDAASARLAALPFPREAYRAQQQKATHDEALRATRAAARALRELRVAIGGLPAAQRPETVKTIKRALAFLEKVDGHLTGETDE